MVAKVEFIEGIRPRVIAWFSHGGSSAVAAALAVGRWPSQTLVVCCDTTASEHPDNERFRGEVERWIDRPIVMLKSKKYTTVDEVFIAERYMSGIAGAIEVCGPVKAGRLHLSREKGRVADSFLR